MIRGLVGRCPLVLCLTVFVGALLVLPATASADAPLSVTAAQQINATEGQPLSNAVVATFVDQTPDDSSSDYSATISWGDGSPNTTCTSTSSDCSISGTPNTSGPWTVRASHTYAEEGLYPITVTVNDTPGSTSGSAQGSVSVVDAGLSLPSGSPATYSGAGGAAGGALQSFESAIGGSDNGTTPGEQSGGFRHITWDDVALNGSDPGSTTIASNHVVSVAPSREQARGIQLSRGVAVANDGFTSVNPSVAGKFPAFSPPNIFAPFNTNRIQISVVAPAYQTSSTSPAATRGIGVMFLNTWQAGATPGCSSTTIQYYSGTTLIGTACAPVAAPGQPSFVGLLFPSPAVTQVTLTLGTGVIFSFDGSRATAGSQPDSPPSGTTNLVAADDVVLAEPAATQPTIQATAGVPVSSGALDSFSDTDPNGSTGDFNATVDWGDGSQSGAGVNGGGDSFSVSGSHTYMRAGTFQVVTTVTDYGGSTQTGHVTVVVAPRASTTAISCSPSLVAVQHATTCTATVSDVGRGTSITPTGLVGFTSPTASTTFSSNQGCFLVPTGAPGTAACSIALTPGQVPPKTAQVIANYSGDGAHSSSTGRGAVSVRAQRCTIKLVSKRLTRHTARLPVLVTCEIHADIRVTVYALGGRRPTVFAFLNTTVAANRRTTLRIPISRAGRQRMRVKHKRLSLKITVVARPRSRPLKSTVTVRGVKVS